MPDNFEQWVWFVFYSGGSAGGWVLLAIASAVVWQRKQPSHRRSTMTVDAAQIPFSVCYAIQQHILTYGYSTHPSELAAAALNAWPGITLHVLHPQMAGNWIDLPLPQENINER